MRVADNDIVAWVSKHVLPLEVELRGWLTRTHMNSNDIDDTIQEIYCRLLEMKSVDHIQEPRAYIYRMVRNILVDQFRNKSVVNIQAVQNLDDLLATDASATPEEVVLMRSELRWVMSLIGALPERCKKVFELRKVYGLSEAETARNLSITDNIVEKETARGLKLMSDMIKQGVSPLVSVDEGKLCKPKAMKTGNAFQKTELQ